MKYTIHALAGKLGITQETIRHYKNLGLLSPEQNPENGYYYYDELDAVRALSVRRYRSMDLSIGGVHDIINGRSAKSQLVWLEEKEQELSRQIEMLQHDRQHIREIHHYMEMTIANQGAVELVNWKDDFSALYLLGENIEDVPEGLAKQWVDAMPYTYLTLCIPREQLMDFSRTEKYDVRVGMGCIARYRDMLGLSVQPPVKTVPGGLSIRTFVAVDDLFCIYPKQLAPMISYVREHRFRFTDSSTGWILVTDYSQKKAKYLVLIRARLE